MDPSSSFLRRLREQTRAAHQAIERVPSLAALMDPGLTPAVLVGILHRLHAFHAALHAPLADALAPIPAARVLQDATRLDALVEDLAFFGRRPDSTALMIALPHLVSPGQALGHLYVIEGSGLGGRVIARRLEDHLGLTATAGASFFAGRTAHDLRLRFHRLTAILDQEAAASPTAAAAIIAGANEAFECFAAWMSAAGRVDNACRRIAS